MVQVYKVYNQRNPGGRWRNVWSDDQKTTWTTCDCEQKPEH